MLYGATTGRDGIGGASVLASQELDGGSRQAAVASRSATRSPGKKLIEASLELVERGLVESLQDCGAAGLASSLAEMASDGAGIDVHLDRVPQREDAMEPWEIMISESQERMVAVVRPQLLDAVREVCGALGASVHRDRRGHATAATLHAFYDGETVGEIPARFLTDECPRYDVEQRAAARARRREPRPRQVRVEAVDLRAVRPPRRLAHRAPSRARRGRAPAGAVAARPRRVARRARRFGCAPFDAGAMAVFGAARNVACAGGQPLGLTDCLNFGNPEKPEVAWELAQAIDGIAAAASALGIPVVSGNVSLYNETRRARRSRRPGRRLCRARAATSAGSRGAGAPGTPSCSPAFRQAPSTRRQRLR